MIRNYKIILLSVLVMLLAAVPTIHSIAQSYHFKNYSVDEGLGQAQVADVFQDHMGVIWLGSNGGGLTRFDGQTFTVYTVDNGLASNVINKVYEDSKNRLWICTANGISVWLNASIIPIEKNFNTYKVSDGLPHNQVWTVMEDQEGNLIFGTTEGLSTLLPDNEQRMGAMFENSKLGLSHNIVRTILQDQTGVFWYGTENGLTSHDPNASSGELFKYYSIKDGLADDFIWCSYEDSESNIWFGTGLGISRMIKGDPGSDEKRFESIVRVDGLRLNIIHDIEEDSQGSIWFAGWAGIGAIEYVPKFNAYRRLTTENGLADNNVMSIIEDSEGNLWMGTYGQGVSKFVGKRFENYTKSQGLPDNFIRAINEDQNENIWIGGNQGGVSRMVRNKNPERISGYDIVIQQYSREDGFSSDQVNAIEVDKLGNLWFCTEDGLFKLNVNAPVFAADGKSKPKLTFKIYTKSNGLLKERPKVIYEDSKGSYWIGYSGGGLHKMSMVRGRATFHENTYKSELLNNFTIFSIHEDRRGDMWFATSGGIVKLSINDSTGLVDQETNLSTIEGLVHNDVRAIVEDGEGNLWFGTGGGISKYNPYQHGKIFENYTTRDGLVSDRVYLLLLDDLKNLWIGTNIGIDVLDLQKYIATKEKYDPIESKYKAEGDIEFRHFGYAEGFLGNETNTPAALKDAEGNLWFGTIFGAIKYNRSHDKENLNPPIIQILGLDLFSNSLDISAPAELNHDQNQVTFKFLGISHTLQEGVTYTYKLDGYSYEWSEPSSSTSATFTNLPIGTFTFQVLATNAAGVVNKEPASYSFTIVPPFWQSIWFYLLVVGGLGFLIYAILKIRLRALEQTARALSEQVEIKTAKLKTSEMQYRTLFDRSGDSIFIYDAETHDFLDCNETAVKMYGYSKEEIRTMKPYDFHRGEDLEEIRKIIEAKPDTPRTYEHFTKSDKKIYVEVQSSEIVFNQKAAVMSIVRDVTARREDAKKIESINKQLTGSIRYSKRILDAILRTKSEIKEVHENSFILFKPRDIVSGDFYWFHKTEGKSIIAAIDCTGHGVAGAFMSLIGNEILDDVVKKQNIVDPGKILSEMHKAVVATVRKGDNLGDAVGGMDVALCCIDYKTNTLEYAGAGRPLILMREGVEMVYPGNKYPVGLVLNKDGEYSDVYMNDNKSSNGVIKTKKIEVLKGDSVYMFTDGYCDQFGGEAGDKFMRERFSNLLASIHTEHVQEQEEVLESTISEWQGDRPQVDDILVIGLKF